MALLVVVAENNAPDGMPYLFKTDSQSIPDTLTGGFWRLDSNTIPDQTTDIDNDKSMRTAIFDCEQPIVKSATFLGFIYLPPVSLDLTFQDLPVNTFSGDVVSLQVEPMATADASVDSLQVEPTADAAVETVSAEPDPAPSDVSASVVQGGQTCGSSIGAMVGSVFGGVAALVLLASLLLMLRARKTRQRQPMPATLTRSQPFPKDLEALHNLEDIQLFSHHVYYPLKQLRQSGKESERKDVARITRSSMITENNAMDALSRSNTAAAAVLDFVLDSGGHAKNPLKKSKLRSKKTRDQASLQEAEVTVEGAPSPDDQQSSSTGTSMATLLIDLEEQDLTTASDLPFKASQQEPHRRDDALRAESWNASNASGSPPLSTRPRRRRQLEPRPRRTAVVLQNQMQTSQESLNEIHARLEEKDQPRRYTQ
ncbi:hypothetical protein BDV98DRAFT_587331 [Pterulicium gracile]|uniref:Uncharacterized protein n=1 Tax=Pterulicium gracile TaxID=1884261 RepID=A0A5C3Q237_9AGAR|nr:hypothetical protein BDV98DRAFT_587331 [Pterula gracilis]